MADFVTDLADLPPIKTDLNPLPGTVDPTQAIAAADYNALRAAAYSLRTLLLAQQLSTNAYLVIGDSNAAGVVPASTDEVEFGTATPDLSGLLIYNGYYALSSSDPPPFIDMGTGALRPHIDSGQTNVAFDLALGKVLIAAGGSGAWLLKMAVSGTSYNEWRPDATYMVASTGANLYNTTKARAQAVLAVAGRHLGGAIINLGTNDAASSGNANAVTARMEATAAQLRTDFGAGVSLVFILTNVNTTGSFVTTVRTQIAAAALAIANCAVVHIDDTPLAGDLLHYTRPTMIGRRAAMAMLDLRGVQRRVPTTPDIVDWGTASFVGSGNMTPLAPADLRHGDTALLFASAGVVSASFTTPSGWTLVDHGDTVSVSGVFEHFALWSKQVMQAELDANNGTLATTTLATIGAENAAQIFALRGPNPFPAVVASHTTVDGSGGFGTGPLTVTGVTATGRAFVFSGGFAGGIGASMTVTNGGVTALAKVKDAAYLMPDTGYQLITVHRCISLSSTGNFTLTTATNMVKGAIVVAVA